MKYSSPSKAWKEQAKIQHLSASIVSGYVIAHTLCLMINRAATALRCGDYCLGASLFFFACLVVSKLLELWNLI